MPDAASPQYHIQYRKDADSSLEDHPSGPFSSPAAAYQVADQLECESWSVVDDFGRPVSRP